MNQNFLKQIEVKNLFFFFCLSFAIFCLTTNFSFADDLNTVFTDINSKTDSLLSWIITGIVYAICVIAAISTGIAIMLKKISWSDSITIFLVITIIGFIPTIVKALLAH